MAAPDRSANTVSAVKKPTGKQANQMLIPCLDWAVFCGEDLHKEHQLCCQRHADRPAYKKARAIIGANLPEVLDGTA